MSCASVTWGETKSIEKYMLEKQGSHVDIVCVWCDGFAKNKTENGEMDDGQWQKGKIDKLDIFLNRQTMLLIETFYFRDQEFNTATLTKTYSFWGHLCSVR